MRKIVLGFGVLFVLLITGCTTTSYNNMNDIDKLISKGIDKNNSPWNLTNLYNKEDKSFFIPYQLWTGAEWDGNKKSKCIHQADSTFYVNGKDPTTIKGTIKWKSPQTGKTYDIWKREKINRHKEQYFVCHEKGIGRVYDSRSGGRYSDKGKCKFPAGYGWKIDEKQECLQTAIKITQIEFNKENNLTGIEFIFWYENSYGELVIDHKYRYEPNIGMIRATKQ